MNFEILNFLKKMLKSFSLHMQINFSKIENQIFFSAKELVQPGANCIEIAFRSLRTAVKSSLANHEIK